MTDYNNSEFTHLLSEDSHNNKRINHRVMIFIFIIVVVAAVSISKYYKRSFIPFTLPNGATVELISVSTFPYANQMWWKPDGTPLALSPIPKDFNYAGIDTADPSRYRTLIFKVTNCPNDIYFTISEINIMGKVLCKFSTRQAPLTSTSKLIFIDILPEKPINSLDIKFKLSSSIWETVSTLTRKSNTFINKNYVTKEGISIVSSITTPVLKGNITSFEANYNIPDEKYIGRINALGKDGQFLNCSYPSSASSGSTPLGIMSYIQSMNYSGKPEDIREMRVDVKPVTIIEYKKIALKPHGINIQNSSIRPLLFKDTKYYYSGRQPYAPIAIENKFSPIGITSDRKSKLFIMSQPKINGKIEIITCNMDARLICRWYINKTLTKPISMTAVDKGYIYIADKEHIEKYSSTGKYLNSWKIKSKDGNIVSITADTAGNLYVATQVSKPLSYLVMCFTSNGVYKNTVLTNSKTSSYVHCIYIDLNNQIYILSSGNPNGGCLTTSIPENEIVIDQYTLNGISLHKWSAKQFVYPTMISHVSNNPVNGISIDNEGIIYLAQKTSGNCNVSKYLIQGAFLTNINVCGSSATDKTSSIIGNAITVGLNGVIYSYDNSFTTIISPRELGDSLCVER